MLLTTESLGLDWLLLLLLLLLLLGDGGGGLMCVKMAEHFVNLIVNAAVAVGKLQKTMGKKECLVGLPLHIVKLEKEIFGKYLRLINN